MLLLNMKWSSVCNGGGGMLFHDGRNFKMREDKRSDNLYSEKLPIQLLRRALTETKVPI